MMKLNALKPHGGSKGQIFFRYFNALKSRSWCCDTQLCTSYKEGKGKGFPTGDNNSTGCAYGKRLDTRIYNLC